MMNKAESGHKGVQTLEKPSGSSCVEVISSTDDPVIESKKQWKNLFQRNRLASQGLNPTIAAVERYIETNWNYIAKPKVYYHNDGYFLVKFGSAEDRDKVMYAGSHMMDNKPIIIKEWEPEFDLSHKCQAKEDNTAKPKGRHGIQKNMPPKRRNGNQSAPQPKDSLGDHVSHVEFRAAFTTLAQLVAAQNEWPAVILANPVAKSAATRIRDFT
ncbi:hypothetical protein BC332_07081 [Capsicum chinense]|nr:hypothetical protein BC332_07081 [Capsicum chinense]